MTSRFFHRTCLASFVFAAGLAVPAEASSIVMDGSFESPMPCVCTGNIGDGWTVTLGTIDIDQAQPFEPAHSGSQLAYMDYGFAPEMNTLTQTLTTVPGQLYMVSYWVASDAPDLFSVSFDGQVLFNGNTPVTGETMSSDYVNFMFTVMATSTSSDLSFTGEYMGGAGSLLDDVSVTPVAPATDAPEPATFIYAGLGLIALFACGRRRG